MSPKILLIPVALVIAAAAVYSQAEPVLAEQVEATDSPAEVVVDVDDDPIQVQRCKDAAGNWIAWREIDERCPVGTVGTVVELEDACAERPDGEHCSPCESVICPPPDAVPVEYMCCHSSGEDGCVIVTYAADCHGDYDLLPCEYGQTQPDGTVKCF
jgi:hypothetical protein